MESQFTQNSGPELQEVTHSITQLEAILTRSTQYTQPKDIREIIKRLPSAKAPGTDGITNMALKYLPPLAITTLNNIFKSCIRYSYFPKAWKNASIIMITKPHKIHNVPTIFRPISLQTTNQLQKHFKPKAEQHAFRLDQSTTNQLVKLTDELAKNMNNKRQTAVIFLDVEKAIDRVWHDWLHKLRTQADTPKHLIKLIQSFLKDRSFNIKIQDKTSSSKNIVAGVLQGSCLSQQL